MSFVITIENEEMHNKKSSMNVQRFIYIRSLITSWRNDRDILPPWLYKQSCVVFRKVIPTEHIFVKSLKMAFRISRIFCKNDVKKNSFWNPHGYLCCSHTYMFFFIPLYQTEEKWLLHTISYNKNCTLQF